MVGWLRPTVGANLGGDSMSDDVISRVEKQMEGTNLALAAVAEVLQKMDARFSADEDAELRKAEDMQAEAEHTALVKEIATAVVSVIKADNELGVDGTKVNNASSTGKTAANADDSEKKVAPDTKTENVQATIQAMLKGDEEEDEYPADEKNEEDALRKEGEEKDEEEDQYARKAADEKEEDDDDDAMAEMRKRLDALKKQVAEYEGSMEKAIKVESENRLRKMGFAEDRSLASPQTRQIVDGLGVDGSELIQKGQSPEDTVDQLASLSYKQLREMQTQLEAGNTDGLPRELIN